MTRSQLIATAALLLGIGPLAHSQTCAVAIESNDLMQFNLREMSIARDCTEIAVTLKHAGKLEAKVMGHDWVLAKSSDVSGILSAAMAAGAAHGYLPEGDKRIIAATRIVGGGESSTVTFSAGALREGESYTFFCTTPGHATVMRGRFSFGESRRVAQAGK